MLVHAPRSIVLGALAVIAACGSDGPLGPTGGTFTPGQSLAVESGRDVRVTSDGTAGTYLATVVNIAQDSSGKSGYSLRASGVEEVDRGLFGARIPLLGADRPTSATLGRDEAFESRLRDRERAELTPRFAAARPPNAV